MKIGVLDYKGLISKGFSDSGQTEELLIMDKIKEMGYDAKLYSVDECQMFFDGKKYSIFERNKPIELCDVLIPRLQLSSRIDLEVSIIKQFQLMKVPVINGYLPVTVAKNKLRTQQVLSTKGIAVPKTVIVRKFEYLDKAIESVGGYPVILKAPFGSYGCGVVIVESRRSLLSALDMFMKTMQSTVLMIQEYVAESEGSDYRVFVVGGKVVASMKRQAKEGDFRSNLHLGGEAFKVDLTPKEIALAIKATKALGLQVSGVDILRTKNGPVIMEVNCNPGFKGLQEITGIDVAGHIVEFAVKFARHRKRHHSLKKVAVSKSINS